jgi:mutator protein MutT
MKKWTVVAGLIEKDGRIFLVKRPKEKIDGGKWEFPGGKVEPGESLFSALKRELKEELGIEVLSAKPYLSTHGKAKDIEFELHLLRVEGFLGEPKPLEAESAYFFTLDEALSLPLCEADERLLKMLR